jgi:hypothetical protein
MINQAKSNKLDLKNQEIKTNYNLGHLMENLLILVSRLTDPKSHFHLVKKVKKYNSL